MDAAIGIQRPPETLRKYPRSVAELWARAGKPSDAGEWVWEFAEFVRSVTQDLTNEMERGLPESRCRNLLLPVLTHGSNLVVAIERWLDHSEDHDSLDGDRRCGSLAGRADMDSIWGVA